MEHKRIVKVALAGNANVGKSSVFNQLTGSSQTVGNWPGKTVERAEGKLHFAGYTIMILDLPGIYSLSTFSIEEIVSRDYISIERPDVIVNVVDASALERNLYFTIQLLELQAPVVMALNQVDYAARRGIRINVNLLSKTLGIPVVPTIAITGVGITELLNTVINVIEGKIRPSGSKIEYGKEIEEELEILENIVREKLPKLVENYPARWISVKLIERDEDITHKIKELPSGDDVLAAADDAIRRIERIHGEPAPVVIASERYGMASHIAREVTEVVSPPRVTIEDKLGSLTAHRFLGYPILAAIATLMFTLIFILGGYVVNILETFFQEMFIPTIDVYLSRFLPQFIVEIICGGFISGIAAGATIALPYIVPFYILLAILEDSGYLPRAAFLMDNLMHKIGLHGKAFMPLLLGYGCNVPACMGCRIMETERERFLAGFVVVLVPCSARSVIILGLVGRYLGLHIALTLYVFDLVLIFVLGRIAYRLLPGEPIGLIMEMPPYRVPSPSLVLKKTLVRTKDFIYVALPLIVTGSIGLQFLTSSGLIWPIADLMEPLISGWLGLPSLSGIPLIFGVLRKELTLILLAELAGTTSFEQILTPIQMIVFTLVTMIYIPCIATIAALGHEFGWKKAAGVAAADISLAILLGGIVYRTMLISNLLVSLRFIWYHA
ncbi:MAG: ferrous iron transport protein B [Candidatus Bathyarchaeia archaeon]|nr:ferrous iron transport protein B [Candidatus Bathyarchaeota archaeon]